jgi:hypothetical protein
VDGRRVGVRGARYASYREDLSGERVRGMRIRKKWEILTVLWRKSALIETLVDAN